MSEAACERSPGPSRECDESRWLERHCEGDASAFDALLRRYRRPVYSYLARCGLDAPTRDDLFQDIFLKVHAGAPTYEPSRPLRAWLFTIAANTVRNHWRDSRNRFRVVDGEDATGHLDPGPGTAKAAHHRETLQWLGDAIAALPIAHREVLVLVALEGMQQQEVAEVLDMPIGTVKTNLRRARLALLAEQRRRETVSGREPDR